MMAEVEDNRRRTAEVRVKLSPAMAERFASIAEGRGVLPATLAALAIGEYVEKYDQQVRMGQMVALDASKRFADAFTGGDGLSKLLGTLMNDQGFIAAATSALPEGNAGQAGSSAGPEAAAVLAGCAGGAPSSADRARTAT